MKNSVIEINKCNGLLLMRPAIKNPLKNLASHNANLFKIEW